VDANLALKERICDATDRIPTSRWPLYSTTLSETTADAATSSTLTFEAERDTLLTDLSIRVIDSVTGLEVQARVDIEYCNVVYARTSRASQWRACCQRKPVFLVGVRENKKLKFVITFEVAPSVNPNVVEVSVSGFQGDGCCS